MRAFKGDTLLLVLLLLIVCSIQDNCAQMSTGPSERYYNLADKTEAVYTGSVSEGNLGFREEYSMSCPDAASRKYRTINGTCNNVRNLGSSFTPQDKILRPEYQDGENAPRQYGVDGQLLPSARAVSLHIHPARDVYTGWTIMMTAWGQWLDHDMVSTPVATRANSSIKCCKSSGECPPIPLDPDCFPIKLPDDEYVFSGKCLEFVRSLAATNTKGVQMVPRQQLNTVTAFHDGSPIYGSTDEISESIREPGSYLLSAKDDHFLPEAAKAGCVKRNGTGDYCFLAGDLRVNQHPYLGAMHTLWLREHNRIARQLRILRPEVSNEDIFQMARRIVIARLQVITFNGYLPIVLGDDVDRWYLRSTSGRSKYNPALDPRVFSSFSAAAFRFGHSTIPSYFPIGDKLINLRYLYNSPTEVYYNFDNVMVGMTGVSKANPKNMQYPDQFFVEDVTKFLFLNNGTGKSLDLITINIHRGRDHGLAPYVKWRAYCGLRPLTGFNDTEALGPFVSQLGRVYRSVDDIDLFTGMMHEPVDTGITGPTVRCLLRIQFSRTKFGDRFFFDNDEPNSRFTDAQLMALRRTSLAEVICLNAYLKYLPLDVFRFASEANPMLPCARLRHNSLNLALFV